MQRLIKNDWFWVALAVALGSISSYFVVYIWAVEPNDSIEVIRQSIGLSLIAMPIAAISTLIMALRFLRKDKKENSLLFGVWYGAGAVLLAHILGSVLLVVLSQFLGKPQNIFSGLLSALSILRISLSFIGWQSIPLGAIFGGLLGWLYTRTHPTPATELPRPDES